MGTKTSISEFIRQLANPEKSYDSNFWSAVEEAALDQDTNFRSNWLSSSWSFSLESSDHNEESKTGENNRKGKYIAHKVKFIYILHQGRMALKVFIISDVVDM